MWLFITMTIRKIYLYVSVIDGGNQLSGDVIWRVLRVTQSKARCNVLDTLTLVVHAVKMPVWFGGVKNNVDHFR